MSQKTRFIRSFLILAVIATTLFALPSRYSFAQTPPSWPTTPLAQICGNGNILGNGPSTAPEGAIVVPAGDNSGMHFQMREANKTFWFEPGVHTLANDEYGQIIPGDNSTFIGAPGAILDGMNINRFAFTQQAQNVRIAYLEIRNFNAPRDQGVVNHDSGKGWVMEYNWIHHNKGAGVFAGTNNILRYNCIADNGQYGFQVYSGDISEVGPSNSTIDHNEVARNNTDDWEVVSPGCGCTGGAKFWLSKDATVTNNWVHDNNSVGLWFDNNNRGGIVEQNFIENNLSEGLFIEAGYDVQVRYNTFKRNAIGKGQRYQATNDSFPIGALYISEDGAPSAYNLKSVPMLISNNYFEDNWGGVELWENADRYSGSTAHTHISGTIKSGDLVHDTACKSSIPNDIPDNLDPFVCRWSTENVIVENNEFHIDKVSVGTGCAGADYCGINGIFANVGSYPEFSGYTIPWRITFQQNNIFRNNQYFGDWKFAGFQAIKPDGSRVSWADWTAPAPAIPEVFTNENRPTTFGQDAGSTLIGGATPTQGAPTATPMLTSTPTPTPTIVPSFAENHLDGNTATQEESLGQWVTWFSSTVTRSSETAHSGSYSMKVEVTAPYNWGVQLANFPGFSATPGAKRISLWAKNGGTSTIQPILTVKWLDANQNELQTDTVTLPLLTSAWQRTMASVIAPVGTSTVLVYLTGSEGPDNYFYVDDIVVGDAPNALDANTVGLESSMGEWTNWYSANISRTDIQAHSGNYSLLAEVTGQWGWGAQFTTWPGVGATSGTKQISYWAKGGAGAIQNVTLKVQWFNRQQELLQTDLVPITNLGTTWKQGVSDVIAPVGTTYVRLEVYSQEGEVGDSVYLDDFLVKDIINTLDASTASFEGHLGEWTSWFSSAISTSTQQSYFGTHSMLVEVTGLWGWGVQFTTWPGLTATPGAKHINYHAKQGIGNTSNIVLYVKWFDANNQHIQTDTVPVDNVSTEWKEGTANVIAPAGTAKVRLEFTSSTGEVGDTIYLDGIIVADLAN